MFIRNIILIIILFTFSINAQFERELNSIPFYDDNGLIPNIFSGGANNFEFFFVDIDGDGDLDFFYLDSDESFGWYENIGSQSNPIYKLSFDTIPGLYFSQWFYFVDIDNDGDYDLLTSVGNNYIELRRNVGTKFIPNFILDIDTIKTKDGNPILTESGCNPVFVDVDGDGDFDFITGTVAGSLSFYKNVGTPQNFEFEFITNEWLGIIIISGSMNSGNLRHGASSIEFKDIDNDGDLDMFWGDFFSRSIYFLENTGTPTNPAYDLIFINYPPNEDSILTSGFNMPRLADIDNDGDLDLFISVLYDPSVPQSLLFYENMGNNFSPDFRLRNNDFFKTLDFGIQSVPVFVDIDNDGDLDLFIGNAKNPDGSIAFFENTGTISSPNFVLRDSSYFNIKGELSLAPAFGDLTGNGLNDLLIGNFDGTISYYQNQGTVTSPNFQFIDKLRNNFGNIIDIGIYARPFLIDIDNDGDLDLAVGRFNGRFSFYNNIGNNTNYIFEENPNYFGTIDVGDNSSPFLIDYDGDGILDLFTGERNGNILYYNNSGTNINPIWNLVTDNFLESNFGGDTNPFFVDIDNDGDLDLFIGNVKGGLYFYRNTKITSINNEIYSPLDFNVAAFPNPFNNQIKIKLDGLQQNKLLVEIYSILGEKIKTIYSDEINVSSAEFYWNGLSDKNISVVSGMYLLSIENGNNRISKKIILMK